MVPDELPTDHQEAKDNLQHTIFIYSFQFNIGFAYNAFVLKSSFSPSRPHITEHKTALLKTYLYNFFLNTFKQYDAWQAFKTSKIVQ